MSLPDIGQLAEDHPAHAQVYATLAVAEATREQTAALRDVQGAVESLDQSDSLLCVLSEIAETLTFLSRNVAQVVVELDRANRRP